MVICNFVKNLVWDSFTINKWFLQHCESKHALNHNQFCQDDTIRIIILDMNFLDFTWVTLVYLRNDWMVKINYLNEREWLVKREREIITKISKSPNFKVT